MLMKIYNIFKWFLDEIHQKVLSYVSSHLRSHKGDTDGKFLKSAPSTAIMVEINSGQEKKYRMCTSPQSWNFIFFCQP